MTPLRADPLYHAMILALCATVLLLAGALSVHGGTQVVVPLIGWPLPELCTTRRFLGLACPGCGLTRAFIALAHGNVAAAWSYNPASLVLFGVMALQVPLRSMQLWRIRRGAPEISLGVLGHIAVGAIIASLLAQWSLRLAGVPL
jgi:hypothetical protein